MQIQIGDYEFTEVWDGVLYKKLSDYPRLSDWEMRTLIEFMDYEKAHGRDCKIVCDNESLRREICEKARDRAAYLSAARPLLLKECTACPQRKGCVTAHVCHTTSVENAVSILRCGSLLSAVKARGLPGEILMRECRNAAKDPADYFEYIMFAWGNCQAGDRLVMERALGRFPDSDDLSIRFKPGVRFYFRYDELKNHSNRVFDGVLPMKVKDEVDLAEWVYRIVVPTGERARIEPHVPAELKDRALYVDDHVRDIWEWSERVYRTIEREEARVQ